MLHRFDRQFYSTPTGLTFDTFPMTWPADYHMHTPLCRHATGEPTEYAARALQLGLTEIGFTDHSPIGRMISMIGGMRLDQLG